MELYAQIACAMPRDPKMIEAGWRARAVYIEAILYCRENLTDGQIDRRALVCWMPDMPVRARTRELSRLAELGLLEVSHTGWYVPVKVWEKWNPSRADVDAKRALERKRKAAYRAKRATVPDVSADVPTGQRVPATSRDKQPKPKPEPEPKPEITMALAAPTQTPAPRETARNGKPRAPDLIWDELLAACGVQAGDVTDTARGAYNAAAKALRKLDPPPGEITRRANAYRLRWPEASLTPTALARRWPECDPASALEHVAPPRIDRNTQTLLRIAAEP